MCTPTCSAAASTRVPLASSDRPAGENEAQGIDRVELSVDGLAMVRLLGPQDRLLRTIERQYPSVQVLVRGNEITLSGQGPDLQAARRLVEELIQLVRNGADLGQSDVTSSARILDSGAGSRQSC